MSLEDSDYDPEIDEQDDDDEEEKAKLMEKLAREPVADELYWEQFLHDLRHDHEEDTSDEDEDYTPNDHEPDLEGSPIRPEKFPSKLLPGMKGDAKEYGRAYNSSVDSWDLPVTFTFRQEKTLQTQFSQLFQLLVQVKHSNILDEEGKSRSGKLLDRLMEAKSNVQKSIRGEVDSKLVPGFSITQSMIEQQNKSGRLHFNVVFDIPGLDKYWEETETEGGLNTGEIKNLLAPYFHASMSLPDPLPPVTKVPFKWSPLEDRLLQEGVEKSLSQGRQFRGETGTINWKLISKRFLPHRTPKQLQGRVGKLRQMRKEPWKVLRRSNAPKRPRMTAEEEKLLLRGMEVFKGHKYIWRDISRNYLPKWTRQELRKHYERRIKQHKKKRVVKETGRKGVQFWNPSMLVFPIGYSGLLRTQLQTEAADKNGTTGVKIMINPAFCHEEEVKEPDNSEKTD